mmetsp:Transcript_112592/g.325316  ORF Transcript_112592/g.325316 Transcript_112592/m.325316 type:complete len:201 (-) Transcript_112592:481-1083(-)
MSRNIAAADNCAKGLGECKSPTMFSMPPASTSSERLAALSESAFRAPSTPSWTGAAGDEVCDNNARRPPSWRIASWQVSSAAKLCNVFAAPACALLSFADNIASNAEMPPEFAIVALFSALSNAKLCNASATLTCSAPVLARRRSTNKRKPPASAMAVRYEAVAASFLMAPMAAVRCAGELPCSSPAIITSTPPAATIAA